jgi:hypothetical protein
MGIGHQNAAVAVSEAAQQARGIVDALAVQGHPQTTQANTVFQKLVQLEGQLFAVPQTHELKGFVPELGELSSQCTGKLAPIKPFIEEALSIATDG